MGSSQSERVAYFDDCRKKRNIAEYDIAGVVSEKEAEEILIEAKAFKREIEEWLRNNYPGLVT
jgi:uncharacterized protein (UPF0332 family)